MRRSHEADMVGLFPDEPFKRRVLFHEIVEADPSGRPAAILDLSIAASSSNHTSTTGGTGHRVQMPLQPESIAQGGSLLCAIFSIALLSLFAFVRTRTERTKMKEQRITAIGALSDFCNARVKRRFFLRWIWLCRRLKQIQFGALLAKKRKEIVQARSYDLWKSWSNVSARRRGLLMRVFRRRFSRVKQRAILTWKIFMVRESMSRAMCSRAMNALLFRMLRILKLAHLKLALGILSRRACHATRVFKAVASSARARSLQLLRLTFQSLRLICHKARKNRRILCSFFGTYKRRRFHAAFQRFHSVSHAVKRVSRLARSCYLRVVRGAWKALLEVKDLHRRHDAEHLLLVIRRTAASKSLTSIKRRGTMRHLCQGFARFKQRDVAQSRFSQACRTLELLDRRHCIKDAFKVWSFRGFVLRHRSKVLRSAAARLGRTLTANSWRHWLKVITSQRNSFRDEQRKTIMATRLTAVLLRKLKLRLVSSYFRALCVFTVCSKASVKISRSACFFSRCLARRSVCKAWRQWLISTHKSKETSSRILRWLHICAKAAHCAAFAKWRIMCETRMALKLNITRASSILSFAIRGRRSKRVGAFFRRLATHSQVGARNAEKINRGIEYCAAFMKKKFASRLQFLWKSWIDSYQRRQRCKFFLSRVLRLALYHQVSVKVKNHSADRHQMFTILRHFPA